MGSFDKMDKMAAYLAIHNMDKILEALAFLGIGVISSKHWRGDPANTLGQTALTWLLLKSGNTYAITTAIGGMAIRDFLSSIPQVEWTGDMR